jgi:nitrate reductase alpha subunit
MHSEKNLSFEEFWKFVNETDSAISKKDAGVFWENYYPWNEFRYFPDIMKERTNLPVSIIFDLESAYELYLASIKLLEPEDVVEATEWIKILKGVLDSVGADNFISVYHCHPEFIYQKILRHSEIESRIYQKIDNLDCSDD